MTPPLPPRIREIVLRHAALWRLPPSVLFGRAAPPGFRWIIGQCRRGIWHELYPEFSYLRIAAWFSVDHSSIVVSLRKPARSPEISARVHGTWTVSELEHLASLSHLTAYEAGLVLGRGRTYIIKLRRKMRERKRMALLETNTPIPSPAFTV